MYKTLKVMEKYIVGLDIGTTKIAVMVGRKDEHGKIEIVGYGRADSIGVARGAVFNIEKTTESIKKAVEEAQLRSHIQIHEVYVGVAGQHIKSFQHFEKMVRDNHENEISQTDIDKLKESVGKLHMDPGEEIISIIPQEFTVDKEHGILDPVGMLGVQLGANFHVITGQINALGNVYRSVRHAGLEVKGLFLEPLASSEAVLDNDDKEAGVALVDIGGGTTDVAIFYNGLLRHTAVIPLGGNIITEDIREGCSILKNQAEALKIKYGSALQSESPDLIISIKGLRDRPAKEISSKNLAGIIQARCEEILEQVLFEIKSSGYEKKLIAGIVLSGGGADLKNIKLLTEYITGADTRVGSPDEHLSHKSEVDENLKNPMYATGIGLVMLGFLEEGDDDEPACETEITEETQLPSEQTVSEQAEETNVLDKEKKRKKEKSIKAPKNSRSLLNEIMERLKKLFDDNIE